MKLKRLIVLSVMVVATLLVCVATGFAAQTEQPAAQAADTPSVSIERFNLSFEDSIYIKYAVKLTGMTAAEVGKENFRLLYWTAPQTEYTVENAQSSSYNLGTQEISGEKYYIFSYEDLAAKQMTDNIYACAYVKVGGVEYYSDVEKYSVLQYAYNKLGYTGTASTDAKLKTLLTEMLSYGAAAQKYFDYNTDRLADSRYYQVTVNGGTLPDGFDSGLYLAGEEVEITAPETDANGVPFSHWTNASGATVSEERTATITVGTKNETYTPVYENPINYSEGLEFTSNGDGTCYVSRIGTCTDTDIIIPAVSPDGDSVTSIGYAAFASCSSLTSITIPDSVTSIGEGAFADCSSLTSITIPDSVTSIGYAAFADCSSLTSITIPDSVTSIGDYAFYNCSSPTSITIPDSVTSIGSSAFGYCSSLTSITVGTNNPYYKSIDGNLYSKDGYTLIQYAVGKSATTFTVPNGVTSIGNYAFSSCSSLTSITIPDSVTSIGDFAFEDCRSLTGVYITDLAAWCNISFSNAYSNPLYYANNLYINGVLTTDITIPDGVTSIGNNAFCQCNLTSITIPDSVTSIGLNAFRWCSSLMSITIPDSVTSIGNCSFEFCTSLTSITIPDSVTSIGDYVFYNCTALTGITISGSITSIGESAFAYCDSLTSITIPGSVTHITGDAFSNCESLSIVYYGGTASEWNEISLATSGNNVLLVATRYYYSETAPTEAGNYWHYVNGVPTVWEIPSYSQGLAFTSNGDGTCYVSGIGTCTDTDVVIPSVSPKGDVVTSIAYIAFANCTNMTSVTLPETIVSIEKCAFLDCKNLTTIVFAENSALKTVGDDVFKRSGVTSIVFPQGLETVGTHVFFSCVSLTSITLPNSVISIGYNTTSYCEKLTTIYYGGTASEWNEISLATSGNNVLLAATRYYYSETQPTESGNYWHYVNGVPTVWEIPSYSQGLAFTSNGDGTCYVSRIGTCTDTDIIIPAVSPDGDSVTSIGDYAFQYCSSLTSVTIPDSVTSIGSYAFSGCKSLNSITIPDSVTSIGHEAFYNCTSLTSITIPDSVTSIGNYAFAYCDSLTSVTIGNGVTSIGNYAFAYCDSLTSVTIGNDVTGIGIGAFSDCWSLTSVHITDLAAWCNIDFYNYASNPLFYANNLYLNGNLITELVIPDGVTSIGNYAFRYCSSLTSITIPNSVKSIGEDAFYNCSSLKSITIGNGVTSIGDDAFQYCTSLTSVTIGNSVTSIGEDAFYDCSSLTSVYYGGTASDWSEISIGANNSELTYYATRYYYSETQPTTTGNYWHYVNGVPTKW